MTQTKSAMPIVLDLQSRYNPNSDSKTHSFERCQYSFTIGMMSSN
jgi:hypothetical protein